MNLSIRAEGIPKVVAGQGRAGVQGGGLPPADGHVDPSHWWQAGWAYFDFDCCCLLQIFESNVHRFQVAVRRDGNHEHSRKGDNIHVLVIRSLEHLLDYQRDHQVHHELGHQLDYKLD